MNWTCLIVDDEPIAQRILESYLSQMNDFKVVATCLDAIQANEWLASHSVDLIFLDLEMPQINGFDFLKTLDNPPAIIITTAYREFALESYDFNVVDYLLKPISMDRFMRALNKFKSAYSTNSIEFNNDPQQSDEYLYVKSERKTIKLKTSDILFLESMNNYLLIHTENEKHIVYSSLSGIHENLNSNFIRIHKSYIINRKYIRSFNNEVVDLGKSELPIGSSYKDQMSRF